MVLDNEAGGELKLLDRVLFWAVFAVVVVMPVDVLCPPPIMNFFYGLQINLWLLVILWLRLVWTTFVRIPRAFVLR